MLPGFAAPGFPDASIDATAAAALSLRADTFTVECANDI